ncbi:MAG: hypothetical protein J6S50_05620 [Oscillospiraceae bacterium]|nr:hypothetical protein [Lachnospiraceae bacterium]MBO7727974.1 hypothetical protein [Oscillospiraceae bacterium]
MDRIEYMAQGSLNRRKSARIRHIEALEHEKRYGRIMAALMLVSGCLIGSGITLMVLGVI